MLRAVPLKLGKPKNLKATSESCIFWPKSRRFILFESLCSQLPLCLPNWIMEFCASPCSPHVRKQSHEVGPMTTTSQMRRNWKPVGLGNTVSQLVRDAAGIQPRRSGSTASVLTTLHGPMTVQRPALHSFICCYKLLWDEQPYNESQLPGMDK